MNRVLIFSVLTALLSGCSLLQGESRPSNISQPGTGGLNVDRTVPSGNSTDRPEEAQRCTNSPDADASAAESVARAAVSKALSSAIAAYSAMYSNVSYEVEVGGASVKGNTATVSGTLTLNAVNRANGQPVSGSYGGVVLLSRTSSCGWVATGYRRNSE